MDLYLKEVEEATMSSKLTKEIHAIQVDIIAIQGKLDNAIIVTVPKKTVTAITGLIVLFFSGAHLTGLT